MAAITTELLRVLDHMHSNLNIAHCSLDLNHVVCSDLSPDKYTSQFKLVEFERARVIGTKRLPFLPTDSESLVY